MTENVSIISSDNVTLANFLAFLKKEGAFNPDDPIFPGRVSSGEKHVWISLSNKELSDVIDDSPEFSQALTNFLVRPPKSFIVIEISRTSGSEKLAVDFAIKILTEWHAVLLGYKNRLLGLDDLRQMQKEGRESAVINSD